MLFIMQLKSWGEKKKEKVYHISLANEWTSSWILRFNKHDTPMMMVIKMWICCTTLIHSLARGWVLWKKNEQRNEIKKLLGLKKVSNYHFLFLFFFHSLSLSVCWLKNHSWLVFFAANLICMGFIIINANIISMLSFFFVRERKEGEDREISRVVLGISVKMKNLNFF